MTGNYLVDPSTKSFQGDSKIEKGEKSVIKRKAWKLYKRWRCGNKNSKLLWILGARNGRRIM